MKKILIVVFIFPLISLARGPAPSGGKVKTGLRAVLPSTGNAFRGVPINVEGCSGVCAESARMVLASKDIGTLNRYQLKGADAAHVTEVIELLPAVSKNLQINGMKPLEAKKATRALVGAAAQSREWNDSQAQENVLAFAQQLAVEGTEEHKEKLAEIERNCPL